MRRALLAAALAMAVAGAALAADAPYVDPWDATTTAAAEAAVARLGAKRALEIVAAVRTIPALAVGIEGRGRGIVATVQQLEQAKRDLGAEETALVVKVELPADVLFDFDKADIRSDAATALAQLATIIAAYPNGRVELFGHTDSKGDDAYNQRLSERRAQSVASWLASKHGVDPARMTTRGLGETKPVADNGTDEGRQKNRRVEAIVHKH
ncbi:MAG TPA: OmpA family protein [Thermoanaerobaculia bacterium]|jgi:outer membrane protein OmpA-like peptidoglycan-associated protein|nr:OmpA family protein [Thermoanaerobaculia bacterium]